MMSTITCPSQYSTVGLIGHIDHGKTSLVGKLTGMETDTHPEEKRRGITIDLGFASLTENDHTFAFIDAPGHQKYIGNLLAGVSAVDIGLLVVACDQGIQEQTLEHVAVLQTLGVEQLIVALSRIDLCDTTRREEITEELEVFLADYGYRDYPIIPVSTVSGEGIDRLKSELRQAAEKRQIKQRWRVDSHFRMPIDRVLNVPGRGLVVAGTVWSGEVHVGDKLQLAGHKHELRVREIEVHGNAVTESAYGVRTAINLTGQSDEEITRGDELVTIGSHPVASSLLIDLQMYPNTSEIRCPVTVQLHTATTSIEARILGIKQLRAGERAVVIVQTGKPIVATHGQALLFRRPYPIGSFGGGHIIAVLDAARLHGKGKKSVLALGEQLRTEDPVGRVIAWVEYLGELELTPDWLEIQLGVPGSTSENLKRAVVQSGRVQPLDDALVSPKRIQQTGEYILKLLNNQAEASDDAWVVEDSIVQRVAHLASIRVIRFAIRRLLDQQALVELNGRFAIASEKTLLSKKQKAKMEQLLALYENARTPPTIKEIAESLGMTFDSVNSLARHAAQQKLLTDLGQGFYISSSVFQTLCDELRQLFAQTSELTVPVIKEVWGVTRKHAIPLLEYCDQQQITARRQDVRVAGAKISHGSSPAVVHSNGTDREPVRRQEGGLSE